MPISAVLDTNVLISGLLFPKSLPSTLLDAVVEPRFELILSEYILEEVEQVLSRIPGVSVTTRQAALRFLVEISQMVTPVEGSWKVRDPNDRPILGTAVAGKADYLVTGDKDILVLREVGSTRVVTVRAFASALHFE
jgi:putative PIN family toxin of toxin-antitoxin system